MSTSVAAMLADMLADLIGPAGSELSGGTPANSANPAKNRTSIDSAGDSGACEGLRKVANSQPEPAAPEPDSQKFAALRRGCNQPQSEHPCGFSQDSQNSQGVAGTNDPPPDWRALHDAYMAHHWRCVHCIAAGRMPKFERCPTGRLLWNTYTATTNSPTTPKGQP